MADTFADRLLHRESEDANIALLRARHLRHPLAGAEYCRRLEGGRAEQGGVVRGAVLGGSIRGALWRRDFKSKAARREQFSTIYRKSPP